MTKLTRDQKGARATLLAARAVTRRTLLKGAAATGAVAAMGPWIVKDAFSSSGEVNWFTWEDYAPAPLLERFTADTGIKINVTTYSSNEDLLNKLRAAKGEGFDLASPSVAWIEANMEHQVLQAIDESKVPNAKDIIPSVNEESNMLGAIQKDGKRYAYPYDWGTEALAFNTDEVKLEYGKASFGDLWDEKYKGRMVARQRSIMLCTGLWMERTGELPEGTMRKAYDEEAALDLGYGKAAEYTIAHKDQIGAFWKGTGDTQQAFLQNGCVIGHTWDGPIFQLKDQGEPYTYLAPVEGALSWVDTIAITAGAANLEQAYAFINWSLQPEIGGIVSDNTGYNSVVVGFDAHVKESYKKNFSEAYPGDALDKLWFQGVERPWFLKKRQEYADKISAA